jgi:hypothetical protein
VPPIRKQHFSLQDHAPSFFSFITDASSSVNFCKAGNNSHNESSLQTHHLSPLGSTRYGMLVMIMKNGSICENPLSFMLALVC